MLEKFFIKRAIKNSISDAGKVIRKEYRLAKKSARDLGKSLSETRVPVKIKVK